STDISPIVNSDQPFCVGPQPYLKVVYSTHEVCVMNCASALNATTSTSEPTPFSSPSPRSELTGFASRSTNGLRRSTGSDSGSTNQPYSQLMQASAPETKNGRCRSMPPSSPPSTGPRMKPMPSI